MKLIKLTQNKFAMVDDEDFEWLNQWKWHYNNRGYASRTDKTRKTILLHREILNLPKETRVDHINQNKLDNRKENLRPASVSQNGVNRKINKNNKSGFRGVYFHNQSKTYRAKITKDRNSLTLGNYKTSEDAAKAYNEKANELFGEFARLNQI